MLIMDSCTAILLGKASILEATTESFKTAVTAKVLEEVLKGKKDMSADALLVDRLSKENKIITVEADTEITQKMIKDFNLGQGEASTIAAAIKEEGAIVATDNRQGRKAAIINRLPLVGSPDIVVSLWKNRKVTKEKAITALKELRKEGWFDTYIIDKAMEDVK